MKSMNFLKKELNPRILILLVTLASLIMVTSSCRNFRTPGNLAPPTDMDITEMSPQSLKIPVIDYSWTYLAGNNHIQIQGTVLNGEERPVQGVIIAIHLYDQDGRPIAYGDTYVSPSYLVPGAKGTFSLMAMVSRQKGVTHTRLISNAQVSSNY